MYFTTPTAVNSKKKRRLLHNIKNKNPLSRSVRKEGLALKKGGSFGVIYFEKGTLCILLSSFFFSAL
jgi:hypothetical protein